MTRNKKPIKSIKLVDSSMHYPDRDRVIVDVIPSQVTIQKIIRAKNNVIPSYNKKYYIFKPSYQFINFSKQLKEIKEFPKEKRFLTTNLSKIDNFCNFLFQKQI